MHTINAYLQETFQYKKPMAHFGLTEDTIRADRVKFDIYLRLYDVPERRPLPTMVIARIGFREKRKGNGTAFLRFITGIAVKYGYKVIEFECCNDNCKAFAGNFGFKFDIPDRPMDCRQEVDKLATYFGLN